MGHKLEEIIPYVPIASTVRVGISIFSYGDNVTFGLTGDYAANPDLDVLAAGIEAGISELLLAAGQHKAAAAADGDEAQPASEEAGPEIPAAEAAEVPAAEVPARKATARAGTAHKGTAGKGKARTGTTGKGKANTTGKGKARKETHA